MKPLLVALSIVSSLAAVPASAQGAREVSYTPESVVPLKARLRFTTMIILPEQEEILDFVCGDKEFWIVSGEQNLAYVKPAKAGAKTNLNLVTASGHVYSFVLTESADEPDLKVFVKADGPRPPASGARFFSAAEVAKLQHQVDDAQSSAEDARRQIDAVRASEAHAIQEKVDQFRASYPTELRFPYRFKAHKRPFNVSAIYTDGRFTYVRAEPDELPALYEVVEGGSGHQRSPNLVNFQVEHGVYIVPKVLDRGYLAIGKQQLTFEQVR